MQYDENRHDFGLSYDFIVRQREKFWPEPEKNDENHRRRFATVDLAEAEYKLNEIRSITGASAQSVQTWHNTFREGGYHAVAKLPLPGKYPRPKKRKVKPIPNKRLWGRARIEAKQEVIRRLQAGDSQYKVAHDMNIRVMTINAWVKRWTHDPENFLKHTTKGKKLHLPQDVLDAQTKAAQARWAAEEAKEAESTASTP